MKRAWRRNLSTQIIILFVSTAIFTALIVVGGVHLFFSWDQARIERSLPPEAIAAFDQAIEGLPADPTALQQYFYIYDSTLSRSVIGEHATIVLLCLLCVFIGSIIFIVFTRKLIRPLRDISSTAEKLAEGNFSLRAPVHSGQPVEIESLIRSFNFLASSLETAEHNIQFTSAAIAHELRTPLTIIRGYLHGMIDGVFAPDREQLCNLLIHIEDLGNLVGDLETLSLKDSDQMRLIIQPVNLETSLHDLVAMLKASSMGNAQLILSVIRQPGCMATTNCDYGKIKQALLALINNARRYGPEKQNIEINCVIESAKIVIQIRDQGPGFSESAISHAHERFWRDETSRSRDSGGSGLGLAVCSAIVDAHGGKLLLSNRPEGGAMVEISIPRLSE